MVSLSMLDAGKGDKAIIRLLREQIVQFKALSDASLELSARSADQGLLAKAMAGGIGKAVDELG